MDGLAAFIIVIVIAAIIIGGIATIATEHALIFWLVIASLGALIAAPIINAKRKKAAQFAALPVEGPMKVNITTEEVPAAFSSRSKYRMHIDVQMSQKDREALKRSGLEMHKLFDYPHPKWEDQDAQYLNCHLFNTKYVDFPDMQALDRAKDELLEGLHALRSRLDQQRHHAQRQRAGQTQETFEI